MLSFRHVFLYGHACMHDTFVQQHEEQLVYVPVGIYIASRSQHGVCPIRIALDHTRYHECICCPTRLTVTNCFVIQAFSQAVD